MRTRRQRTSVPQRRLTLESLEPRRLLDAQLGQLDSTDLPASGPVGEGEGPATGAASAFSRFASGTQLTEYLVKDAVTRYADLFGQETWYWPYPWLDAQYAANIDALPATTVAYDNRDHSRTNNQVAGVEEADMVQTDGDYLYVLANGRLSIVDLQASAGMHVMSSTTTAGQPVAMYLDGTHVTVITGSPMYAFADTRMVADSVAAIMPSYEPSFHVTVLDVSDPAHPQVAQDLKLDGNYIDSREINGFVYVVSQDNFGLPPPERKPLASSGTTETNPSSTASPSVSDNSMTRLMPIWIDPAGQRYVYETQAEYLARIKGQELDLGLPHFAASSAGALTSSAGLLTQPENIYLPLAEQASNLLSITTIAVTRPTPTIVASTSAPLEWASEVYVSPENLYLAMPQWNAATGGENTTLYKFGLDTVQGSVTLAAKGTVPGHLLNQFALDEFGGDLRVVTQQGWRANAETSLYVLRQTDLTLNAIGQLEQIVTAENLYSVRFLGDIGYVVTFGPTGGVWYDPLFTIDLRDPTQPVLTGRLEMPGFSDYLQAVEGHYLLGLGHNADPTNGRTLEPQLSLFDVADLSQPQLAGQLAFASQGSAWSEAFTDHHAVAWYPEYHVLAIPMNNFGPVVDPQSADGLPVYRTQSALWVFRIDVTADAAQSSAIQLLGTIPDESTVRRSVRVGRTLYAISQDMVQACDIERPGVVLDSVRLNAPFVVDPPVSSTGPIWGSAVDESELSADARRMVGLAAVDLAKRLNVPIGTITVAQVESVAWPDSGLGVHQDGQMYLQVVTDGFRIALEHERTRYVYHTDTDDRVILAESTPIAALVRIRLETVDAAGQVLTSVEAGQSFVLNVYVQDMRTEVQGVAAAYLDLLYPESLVDVAGGIQFGAAYQELTSGVATGTGLIKELGAAHGVASIPGTEQLLASVPFRAEWSGLLSFVTVPAQQTDHALKLVGAVDSVATDRVDYGHAQLEITGGWQNANNPADVDGDGIFKPLDVLVLINHINRDGSRLLGSVGQFLQQAAATRHDFVDVNGDGNLTAQDVLMMINRFNALAALGQDPLTDASQGWGWARELSGPLARFVDWNNLADAVNSQSVRDALTGLNLSTEQALAWLHDVSAGVQVQPLVPPGATTPAPVDAGAMVERFGAILLRQGAKPSTARLQGFVSGADKLVDALDWESLLPDIGDHLDLAAVREAVRDQLFAKLADPPALLSVWNG